jgi:dimethylaniline monooxygenase (N-oxide forming)
MSPTPTVAIIGAGPLGLMALKNMTEDGFNCTCFESRPFIGGLWKYSTDASLSVAEATVFNSSRYRSAISDFPFPDDTDDYPTWQQMWAYLDGYCKRFGLMDKIRLNSPVTAVTRENDRWVVEITPKDGGERRTEEFDKVCVAIGSFVTPKTPQLNGIERFGGKVVHAINFREPKEYDGQNVLLIGLHATSQDVAKVLEGHATQLYLSHRNGLVMVS